VAPLIPTAETLRFLYPHHDAYTHVSPLHRGDRSKQVCTPLPSNSGCLIPESYSGVGFGVCERLLDQLSSEHQTDANPQFDIPVESKDVPDERPRWSGLTLIMVCRNMQKAEAARGKLLSYLDRILKARGVIDEHGQNFRENLVIEIEKCDFTSVKSVIDCARGMGTKPVLYHLSSRFSANTFYSFVFRYPYINHLVLNAGTAPFAAIDWFKFICLLLVHPIVTLTVATYIIQRAGERSEDGFGYTWQCNVFGPYLFVCPFPQLSCSNRSPQSVRFCSIASWDLYSKPSTLDQTSTSTTPLACYGRALSKPRISTGQRTGSSSRRTILTKVRSTKSTSSPVS